MFYFNIGDRVPPIGLHGSDPDNLSEVSASAANVTNDGKHPLLEFALRYFRDVQLLMATFHTYDVVLVMVCAKPRSSTTKIAQCFTKS